MDSALYNTPIGICIQCSEVFKLTTEGVECGCTRQAQHDESMATLERLIDEGALDHLRRRHGK